MFPIEPQYDNNVNDLQLRDQRNIKVKTILIIVFFVYLALLFYVTLLAWNYGASLGPVGPGGRNYNIIPFRSIYRISVFSPSLVDPIKILVGNIVLFMPFGFLAPIAFKKLRHSAIIKTTMIGMFLSILIESSQFLFTYRVSNIDDVILNTFGALIGAVIIKFCFFLNQK